MLTNPITLLIFTCEGREHLLKKTIDSFKAACSYEFARVILAIDGVINSDIISYINPDLAVYNYKRKGYVNSINNALVNIHTDYFFWLEDDWNFHEKIDMAHLLAIMQKNEDWAEMVFSQFGPLKPEMKNRPLGGNLYQTPFGFSANPCICTSSHLQSAFAMLSNAAKGDKLGEDGFENFLTRVYQNENIKCVIIDPVDHISISHEGYLETTARNWHMTNSLEERTKEHLLTMPRPSLARKLYMVVKLFAAFFKLAAGQLVNNKVYELCFRVIASAKTIKKDE